MTARAPRVLMRGTAPEGRGGVAARVALLGGGGLFEQARVRSASTRREDSFFSRLEAAARGACLWRRPASVHAHAASQASFARKSLLLWLARCAGCQTIFHLDAGGFRQFATVRSGLLKKDLAQLVERARDTVAQHYSTEAICGRLAAIHNDLAGAR